MTSNWTGISPPSVTRRDALSCRGWPEARRKLEAAGLVTSDKQGRVRSYSLTPDALRPAQDWLSEQRALWEARLVQFDDYVTNLMQERTDGPRSQD